MGKAPRRKLEGGPLRRPTARPPARPAGRFPWRHALASVLGPLLVVLIVAVLYANSFSIPFLFDDFFAITGNPAVKTIEPALDYLRRSRGIPALTVALNYRWGGFSVWGFHLVNVAVHLANGLLVYALVLRTLRLPALRERYRDHAAVLATLAALVFVAHPLQTMAASYIVQRAESIAAFFYLLTLLLYAAAATAAGRTPRLALYGAAVLAALLGVVSKETVATVPAAILAYHLCFLSRGARGSHAARWALAAALLLPLAYGLLLARPYLLPGAETVAPDAPRAWLYIPTAGFWIDGITSWHYLLSQFGVVVWYLRLYVLPTHQCFDYGWPFADSLWRADVLLPLGVLLALAAAAAASYRRYPLATFCLAWVFITLAPTSSIIPLRDAAFEHRMYLPIVGLAWLTVVGGFDGLGWIAQRTGRRAAALRRAGGVAIALWLAVLGAATVARNGVMQDPIALAADSIAKAPDNWRAHANYGEALLAVGRSGEAMPALEEAVRLNPEGGSARVELGQLYVGARRFADAETVLQPATTVVEESVAAAACLQLATVYEARGDRARSEDMLNEALRREPGWSSVHRQLGAFYARAGFWYGAAGHYKEALRIDRGLIKRLGPAAAAADLHAAAEQLQLGDASEAQRYVEAALQLQPDDALARRYLAVVQAAAGAWAPAQATLASLAQSAPDDAWVRDSQQRVRDRQPLVPPALPAPAAD